MDGIDVTEASYRSWPDACVNDRFSQVASGLKEMSSGATFTVAGVHLPTNYQDFLLPRDCRVRNVNRLHGELAAYRGAVVVGGDFNNPGHRHRR